jgi:hypothetical protein
METSSKKAHPNGHNISDNSGKADDQDKENNPAETSMTQKENTVENSPTS